MVDLEVNLYDTQQDKLDQAHILFTGFLDH